MASFSVCILARETPDVLARIVNHYLRLGATRVRIFFDGEAKEAQIPEQDGLDFVVCDLEFWNRHIGQPPSDLDHAIQTVFRVAHESAITDWQFFCDADEFLVSEQPISQILDRVHVSEVALRVMNVEAIWGPGDDPRNEFGCTYMRTPLNRKQERILRLLLPRRQHDLYRKGFLGHADGKSFLRRGAIIEEFSSHHARRSDQAVGKWAHDLGFGLEKTALLHFDAVSEVRWIEKWRRRVSNERPSVKMGAHRLAQFDAVSAAMQAGTLPQLFGKLHCMTRYEAAVLALFGVAQRQRIFSVLAVNKET